MMTEATKNELIKSMAFGFLDADIAEIEEMSFDEVTAFRQEHSAEIKAKEKAIAKK